MNFGLYVIITKPVLPYTKIAEICVKHKIKYLQLREKHLEDRILLKMAKEIKSITKDSETNLIINDRVDICMLSDADGVHLGQDDLPYDEAIKIMPKGKIIGLSTHNLEQAKQALIHNPDYIGFGPIYKTPTKENPDPVVGCNLLKEALGIVNIPVVAIGGIDENNLEEVLKTGTNNLSLVRYLMNTDKFEERLINIKEKIRMYK
ncbi:MAG: thiamine phosphate synthase [Candidatus Cloacimonetes bacterium]|nr:thiamine phosphate synthase [Candidatus Cloacimonadota bacterium]MDD4157021.1 thiamine phosphate synthase [Candidatus Cloacimonadota bacterium]